MVTIDIPNYSTFVSADHIICTVAKYSVLKLYSQRNQT